MDYLGETRSGSEILANFLIGDFEEASVIAISVRIMAIDGVISSVQLAVGCESLIVPGVRSTFADNSS